LATILKIPEKQMVIISVTEGSVIVELGFLRLDAAQASPNEIVLRLKAAATSGELEKFGLTDLTVGQETVFEKSSNVSNVAAIVGASVGSVIGVFVLVFAVCRWRRCGIFQVIFASALLSSCFFCFAAH
jgi:hypothetical protein